MLGSLLDQVRSAVSNHPDQPGSNFESSGLMSTIEGLFGQHAQNTGQVLLSPPNSYGDLADQRQPARPARPGSRLDISFSQCRPQNVPCSTRSFCTSGTPSVARMHSPVTFVSAAIGTPGVCGAFTRSKSAPATSSSTKAGR